MNPTQTEATWAGAEDEPGLNPEALREIAHREVEIARLMGPSYDMESAWLEYCERLVTLGASSCAISVNTPCS